MTEKELRYIGDVLRDIDQLLSVIAGVKSVEEYREDRLRGIYGEEEEWSTIS